MRGNTPPAGSEPAPNHRRHEGGSSGSPPPGELHHESGQPAERGGRGQVVPHVRFARPAEASYGAQRSHGAKAAGPTGGGADRQPQSGARARSRARAHARDRARDRGRARARARRYTFNVHGRWSRAPTSASPHASPPSLGAGASCDIHCAARFKQFHELKEQLATELGTGAGELLVRPPCATAVRSPLLGGGLERSRQWHETRGVDLGANLRPRLRLRRCPGGAGPLPP